jgi:type II secretory pathway component PulF
MWYRKGHLSDQLAVAIRELATLLSAGIPLLEALDIACEQSRGGFREALQAVRDRVSEGSGLAEAMREQSGYFDELSIQMVDVGEQAGTLDRVLEQLADFSDRYRQLKDRVLTALLYPAIVFIFGLLVALFLVMYVVPMLLDNLLDAGQQLPWPTRILKSISDFLLGQGHWLGLVFLATIFCLSAVLRTSTGRRTWHRLLLKLPLLGKMALKQSIARIAMVVSTLLRSGVVFVRAGEIAARATKNEVVREALQNGLDAVTAGRDIGEALRLTGIFPSMVVQIFTVGQQSGTLDAMLGRLADDYDRQVASLSTRLVTIMEPALIVCLAIFVGFILFATMLPILEAGNVL